MNSSRTNSNTQTSDNSNKESSSLKYYSEVPSNCLPYHPQSELNGLPGYYPNINNSQLIAVNDLKAALIQEYHNIIL